MKPAGPCRGIGRSFRDAFWFSLGYGVLGLGLVPLIARSAGVWDNSEGLAMLLCFHAFSACVVLIAAWPVQWALLRICRPRSWRGEGWRIPIAAVVAVTLEWEAILRDDKVLIGTIENVPGLSTGLILLFIPALSASAAMAAAWMIPSFPRRVRSEGTVKKKAAVTSR